MYTGIVYIHDYMGYIGLHYAHYMCSIIPLEDLYSAAHTAESETHLTHHLPRPNGYPIVFFGCMRVCVYIIYIYIYIYIIIYIYI